MGSEELFRVDRDRFEFVGRMHEAADKHAVNNVAFTLMGNHVHLVLHCPQGGLAAYMHCLESVYAREFNMRHGRRGALFAAGYFNKVLRDEGQALATIRYVHRNALELGIDIRHYPWSSYPAYVDGDDTLFRVVPEVRENLLGGAEEHRRYVETDTSSDLTAMSHGVRRVYSPTPDFVHWWLADLCTVATAHVGVTMQEIVAPRSRARNDARLAVTLIAYESRSGFAAEVQRFLGYRTGAALRSAVNRARARTEADEQFRRLVGDIRRAWAALTTSAAG